VRIVQSPRQAQTVRQFLTKHIDTLTGVEQAPSESLGECRQSFGEKPGGGFLRVSRDFAELVPAPTAHDAALLMSGNWIG
jgi:hypothetical protein